MTITGCIQKAIGCLLCNLWTFLLLKVKPQGHLVRPTASVVVMTVGRNAACPLSTTPTAQCAAQVDFASRVRPDIVGFRGKVA